MRTILVSVAGGLLGAVLFAFGDWILGRRYEFDAKNRYGVRLYWWVRVEAGQVRPV